MMGTEGGGHLIFSTFAFAPEIVHNTFLKLDAPTAE
jgi:hypothetical protein